LQLTDILLINFPLLFEANLLSQLILSQREGIPHFRQTLAGSGFAEISGWQCNFMAEEEEAAIRKIFFYLIFWRSNRRFFLLISNYLCVIPNAVRNPLLASGN